jgi:hypothetical protein
MNLLAIARNLAGLGEESLVGVPDSVTVGAATTAVLAADPKRQAAVLTNDGDEKMYVGIGAAAVVGKGVPLPVGASIVLTPRGGCRLAINAICASGGKSMATHTFVTV